jgi:hypothetical protein
MRSRRPAILAVLAFLAGCSALGGFMPPPAAPIPSLVDAKREVAEYVGSGRYDADIATIVNEATAYLSEPASAARQRLRLDRRRTV